MGRKFGIGVRSWFSWISIIVIDFFMGFFYDLVMYDVFFV